jgi:hypothetical protein
VARIRTIKPEFPQSETVGKLSRDARLLFIMLWTISDDEGRLRAASRMLASLLYPYDDDARDLIDGWLDELEREGCIERYVVDGATYLQIRNWLKHQKIDKPTKSRLPPPDDSSRALAKAREDSTTDLGSRIVDQDPPSRTVAVATAAGGQADLVENSPAVSKAVAAVVAGKLFEDFWAAYAKRDGANPKEPAKKRFIAAVMSGEDADAIIAGARGYAEELRRTNKLNTSYVAQAVTWLNQRRWVDYQAQPARAVKVDPDPGVTIDPIWAPARAHLLADLGPEVFSSWFRNVAFLAIVNGNRVCMNAPSRFMKSQIEKDYMARLLRAWQATKPEVELVEIIVAADGKKPPDPLAA